NRLTVWSSTQIPHLLKTQISLLVGLPETAVRVIAPEVGGGFGSKLNVYGEEGVVPWLAMKTGRPVKWNEGRRENFMATIHGRDALNDERIMELGAREMGMDPAEFRRKNFPLPKEFPYTTVTGLTYDSAKYQESLAKALKLSGYDSLRRRQKDGWKKGKYYGIGVST